MEYGQHNESAWSVDTSGVEHYESAQQSFADAPGGENEPQTGTNPTETGPGPVLDPKYVAELNGEKQRLDATAFPNAVKLVANGELGYPQFDAVKEVIGGG